MEREPVRHIGQSNRDGQEVICEHASNRVPENNQKGVCAGAAKTGWLAGDERSRVKSTEQSQKIPPARLLPLEQGPRTPRSSHLIITRLLCVGGGSVVRGISAKICLRNRQFQRAATRCEKTGTGMKSGARWSAVWLPAKLLQRFYGTCKSSRWTAHGDRSRREVR